ncbi:NosL family protein [Oryzomonas sagensis]|uniref:NosL family protein n=1 Tax=Oryzomonas sagensis TaxID=2603857 RepID=A0ABQ6TPZ9_9BACT|nr:nitrous oxide reductase accessory protein NosL [Oryzomonas sagensis]KAB0670427.1 NosL family protein [Oryzomonas sagensis]
MKHYIVFLMLILLSTFVLAGVPDTVEGPKACKRCGMDRTAFARSRMLVMYADGTTVGVCSLHCAVEEMQRNRGKQVRSLMVADYTTKKLVDVTTAIWVVGGKKQGVMTALPTWAFARMEGARSFIGENGGTTSSFDGVLNSALREVQAQAAEERAVVREIEHELNR